jgi:hypothetical protein
MRGDCETRDRHDYFVPHAGDPTIANNAIPQDDGDKEFVGKTMTMDWRDRPTENELLEDEWFDDEERECEEVPRTAAKESKEMT